MITVRRCYSLPEAQVVQSHLGGSGIETFLPDELTVQTDWLWTNAIGGVRVQVHEEDAERAMELLDEESVSAEKAETKICPHCASPMQQSYGYGVFPKILLVLLLSLPIRSKATWRCPKCGTVLANDESST